MRIVTVALSYRCNSYVGQVSQKEKFLHLNFGQLVMLNKLKRRNNYYIFLKITLSDSYSATGHLSWICVINSSLWYTLYNLSLFTHIVKFWQKKIKRNCETPRDINVILIIMCRRNAVIGVIYDVDRGICVPTLGSHFFVDFSSGPALAEYKKVE